MCVRLMVGLFLSIVCIRCVIGGAGSSMARNYEMRENQDQYHEAFVEIEYNWKLLVTDTYIEPYSSLWKNITGLMESHSEFEIKTLDDITPITQRQNITYNFEDALDLWNRNGTIIWNTSIDITSDKRSAARDLVTYVNDDNGLSVDIINLYDGYWGLLNIVNVQCDAAVNYYTLHKYSKIMISFLILIIG